MVINNYNIQLVHWLMCMVKLSVILILCVFSLCMSANAQVRSDVSDTQINAETDIEGDENQREVFGSSLFQGQLASDVSSGLNPEYKIAIGDKINLALWGKTTFNEVLTVDPQGNIFIPDVGPVKVAGLPLSRLNDRIKSKIAEVYKEGVSVYTTLGDSRPVSVFVTGNVRSPGRYSGVSGFTLLHYIDMARGIDPDQGSYRDIKVIRNGETVSDFDIYEFLNNGVSPDFQLRDNDTVLVGPRQFTATASGLVRKSFRFEFLDMPVHGKDIAEIARPLPGASNVSIEGIRDDKPFLDYMTMKEFLDMPLASGDSVAFRQDGHSESLRVEITGQHLGQKEMILPVGSRLIPVLDAIPVNPEIANIQAIQLHRKSVADKQKRALAESLDRLEQAALTQTPVNEADARQKAQEMEFLNKFIVRAKKAQPEGRVVVARKDGFENVLLENGDKIVIPAITSLVLVNGEVYDPKAVVYKSGENADYYINKAGGFTEFARDKNGILVMKANGESIPIRRTVIEPGDEIIILPEFKLNSLQLTKEIVDVIYRATVAAAIPINLLDDD